MKTVTDLPRSGGYRIAWRSLLTGASGGGEACLGHPLAAIIAEALNRSYPDFVHWVTA
jgi:hypothetical protein